MTYLSLSHLLSNCQRSRGTPRPREGESLARSCPSRRRSSPASRTVQGLIVHVRAYVGANTPVTGQQWHASLRYTYTAHKERRHSGDAMRRQHLKFTNCSLEAAREAARPITETARVDGQGGRKNVLIMDGLVCAFQKPWSMGRGARPQALTARLIVDVESREDHCSATAISHLVSFGD